MLFTKFRNTKRKKILNMIYYKLTNYGQIDAGLFGVHKVRIFLNKITIYTSRPGLLIGKAGRTINELTDYINEKYSIMESNFKIKIIEFHPLNN